MKNAFILLAMALSTYCYSYDMTQFVRMEFPEYYQAVVVPAIPLLSGATSEQRTHCLRGKFMIDKMEPSGIEAMEYYRNCIADAEEENVATYNGLIGRPSEDETNYCLTLADRVIHDPGIPESFVEAVDSCLKGTQLDHLEALVTEWENSAGE